MALLDNKFKQRMVGALVLIALAVVFLPMLFSRSDEQREVHVPVPAAPQAPVVPEVKVEPAQVPEPQILEPLPTDPAAAEQAPSMPIAPAPAAPAASKPAAPATPAPAAKPAAPPVAAAPASKASVAPTSKIDPNGLPVSWSVQVASLANRAGADNLQKTLRSQGYNAYVRSAEGKNRVYVGPLVERAEADRLRDVINRQQNLKGFVVRFEPEKG